MLLQLSFIFRKMFLLHKLTSPNLTYAHCVAHKTSMPNQPYPLHKLSCLHPTPILASLFVLPTAFLTSVSGFSNESDFFYRHGTLTDCPMGQVLQFAWPFTQNLMPSTVEPPKTDEIPTSGPNKIIKACKPPHHVKA